MELTIPSLRFVRFAIELVLPESLPAKVKKESTKTHGCEADDDAAKQEGQALTGEAPLLPLAPRPSPSPSPSFIDEIGLSICLELPQLAPIAYRVAQILFEGPSYWLQTAIALPAELTATAQ